MAFRQDHPHASLLLTRTSPSYGPAPDVPSLAPRHGPQLLAGRALWSIFLLVASLTGVTAGSDDLDRESPASRADAAASAGAEPARLVVDDDIVFASPDGVPLQCDIYRTASTEGSRPAVLVIHGGGWSSGDKWTMSGPARQMARAGLIAVAVNYRHAPDHTFPAQLDDVRLAFDWVKANAETYGIDPKRIGVFGYSAGGHLAAMLAVLADEPLETQRATSGLRADHPLLVEPVRPAAVVAGGAPCEFRNLPPDNTILAYFFGGSRREKPSLYRNASPTVHASPHDVAIQFLHGTGDLLVPPRSARTLFEKHQELGVPSRWYGLEDLGHLFAFLSPELREQAVEYLVEEMEAAGE